MCMCVLAYSWPVSGGNIVTVNIYYSFLGILCYIILSARRLYLKNQMLIFVPMQFNSQNMYFYY